MSERARTWFIALLIVAAGYLLIRDKEVVVYRQIRTSPAMYLPDSRYSYYPFGDPEGRYAAQDVI